MTHFCDCTKLLCESQKQKPEATSQTVQDEDPQALLQRGKTEIKEERGKKRILTALNQASRKRFTFEYGRCSSKRTEFARKRRKQDREERKAPLHRTEKRRERAIRMQTSPTSHYIHN